MPEYVRPKSGTFTEISGGAKAKINEYYGEWTDLNAHDPGITLIELFSWLTEMQRYFIDASAEAELLFNLLGVKQCHAAPAVVHVELTLETPGNALVIPAGTPVYAENTRFEITAPKTVSSTENVTLKIGEAENNGSDTAPFFPFGETPEAGKTFQVLLQDPIPMESTVISVKVRDTLRNRMPAEDCVFLSKLRWECLTEDGFKEIPVFDASCGLLTNGDISLDIGDDTVTDGNGNHVIRCTLESNEYDISPALISLKTNIARFKQTHTFCEMIRLVPLEGAFRAGTYLAINGDNLLLSERDGVYECIPEFEKTIDPQKGEAVFKPKGGSVDRAFLISCEREYLHHRFLGMTRGFPNQRLKAESQGRFIVYDNFLLLVADSPELDRAVLWEKTDSLHRSGPYDRHYELDEQTGEIIFGDGFHGLMPTGLVMIASLAVTEGSLGNIKAGGLEGFQCAGAAIRVHQEKHAKGGCDRESGKDALKRTVNEDLRTVTARDYEKIVKLTPGLMIEDVSAFVSESETERAPFPVTIAVKPRGRRGELSEGYKKHILEWLEPYRLAGTKISVVSPVYVNVRLTAELRGRTYLSDIRQAIEKKLRDYFDESFGHFGARITFREVLAFLDSLPETARTLSLHMRADGHGAAVDDAGNIILEQRCIACLGQVDIIIY